jgi:hypothetical protein
LEGGHVAGDGAGVVCGGVDLELAGPQVEAVQVHLGGGPVAELQVEDGQLGPQGRLAGSGRVVGLDRPVQRTQGARHLGGQEPGKLIPANPLPGRGHGVDP